MSTLYLHIGHMKTGSSWIQSCLRYNRDILFQKRIEYVNGNDAEVTDPRTITSGNFANLLSSEEKFDDVLKNCTLISKSSLLFSSELIFVDFSRIETEKYISKVAKEYGFDKIEVLLFIRNPISLVTSHWQQSIKRGGQYLIDISNTNVDQLSKYTDNFINLERALRIYENKKDVNITVINYSRNKSKLLEIVTSWLNLPSNSIVSPPIKRVNRSMTVAELKMQQILNSILGKSGHLISDPLCENLPDIEPSQIYPPIHTQEAIWEKVQPSINSINSRIPLSQHYQCDIKETELETEFYTFTNDQIKVITESLGNEIKRLQEENKSQNDLILLKNEEINQLNNVLIQISLSKSWTVTKPLRFLSKLIKKKTLLTILNGGKVNSKNTKVVYTIILGDYDTLKEPEIVNPEFDYICFTNRKDIKSDIWQFKYVKCNKKISLKRCSAKYVTMPYKYLKSYDLSVLVGGQTSIHCNIGEFVTNVLPDNKNIAVMRNPYRNCIYKAAKVIIESKRDKEEIVNKQMQKYRDEGYPENAGLIAGGIMVRRHTDKKVNKHCKLWYKEIKNHSQRDQLSFNYVMWKYKLIDPAYFSADVWNSDFIVHSHNYQQIF